MDDCQAQPIRVLQLFTPEALKLSEGTTPLQRLEWLEFVLMAVWAGAAYRDKYYQQKKSS